MRHIYNLKNEKPDVAIIHIGTNDITNRRENKSVDEIVQSVIDVAKTCRNKGVNEVFISSLLCRKDRNVRVKIDEINSKVRSVCVLENFNFISNFNIGYDFV